MTQIHANLAGKIVLAPFDVFAQVITAGSLYPGLLVWASIGLANRLADGCPRDGPRHQLSGNCSNRQRQRYEMRQRMRRGGVSGMSGSRSANVRIWQLPRLAGAGLSRAATHQRRRSSARLLILLAIIGVACTGLVMGHRRHEASFCLRSGRHGCLDQCADGVDVEI